MVALRGVAFTAQEKAVGEPEPATQILGELQRQSAYP